MPKAVARGGSWSQRGWSGAGEGGRGHGGGAEVMPRAAECGRSVDVGVENPVLLGLGTAVAFASCTPPGSPVRAVPRRGGSVAVGSWASCRPASPSPSLVAGAPAAGGRQHHHDAPAARGGPFADPARRGSGAAPQPRRRRAAACPAAQSCIWPAPRRRAIRSAFTIDDGYCSECVAKYAAFAESTASTSPSTPTGYSARCGRRSSTSCGSSWPPAKCSSGTTHGTMPTFSRERTRNADELQRNEDWIQTTFGVTSLVVPPLTVPTTHVSRRWRRVSDSRTS